MRVWCDSARVKEVESQFGQGRREREGPVSQVARVGVVVVEPPARKFQEVGPVTRGVDIIQVLPCVRTTSCLTESKSLLVVLVADRVGPRKHQSFTSTNQDSTMEDRKSRPGGCPRHSCLDQYLLWGERGGLTGATRAGLGDLVTNFFSAFLYPSLPEFHFG